MTAKVTAKPSNRSWQTWENQKLTWVNINKIRNNGFAIKNSDKKIMMHPIKGSKTNVEGIMILA